MLILIVTEVLKKTRNLLHNFVWQIIPNLRATVKLKIGVKGQCSIEASDGCNRGIER
jgi:hypothetical protein